MSLDEKVQSKTNALELPFPATEFVKPVDIAVCEIANAKTVEDATSTISSLPPIPLTYIGGKDPSTP